MAFRIWLLLGICAMLSLPAKRAEAIVRVAGVEELQGEVLQPDQEVDGQEEGPSMETDQAPFPDDIRQSERLELVTVVVRMSATGADNAGLEPPLAGENFAPQPCRATVWSDQARCRRQAGRKLLHAARPPPSCG